MAEIPRLFSETPGPQVVRSQSAWESLMDRTTVPTYSARTLHSRALYEYNSSGRVLDKNHSFYNSQDYKRERKTSQIKTKIDLTLRSDGVKQVLSFDTKDRNEDPRKLLKEI